MKKLITAVSLVPVDPEAEARIERLLAEKRNAEWAARPTRGSMTPTKKALEAILKYTENAPTHSALSTVRMLAIGAMEEHNKDLELMDNLPKNIRDAYIKDN